LNITQKRKLTVVVTDSGIGGIAIAAELYRRLKDEAPYDQARIIYFNALFDERSGYNILKSLPQKTAIFDTALHRMLHYAPDMIVLASNTLSVIYPSTPFSQSAMVPVVGLVKLSVNQILLRIQADLAAAVIILATPVTINDGSYRKMLREHLADSRIIEQACEGLERAIGDGNQETIQRLIQRYVSLAIQQLPAETTNVYASLNCTHFGYYQAEFLKAFQQEGINRVDILNPNMAMVQAIIPGDCPPVEHCDVSIEFVSKVKFHPQGMQSLIPYLAAISEDIVTAFQHYHYDPALF
jgi:glutamate racemase